MIWISWIVGSSQSGSLPPHSAALQLLNTHNSLLGEDAQAGLEPRSYVSHSEPFQLKTLPGWLPFIDPHMKSHTLHLFLYLTPNPPTLLTPPFSSTSPFTLFYLCSLPLSGGIKALSLPLPRFRNTHFPSGLHTPRLSNAATKSSAQCRDALPWWPLCQAWSWVSQNAPLLSALAGYHI